MHWERLRLIYVYPNISSILPLVFIGIKKSYKYAIDLRPRGALVLKRSNKSELQNVAIELQLEAAQRRVGPIPFNTSPMASLKSLSLSVAVLERIYW